MKLSLHVSQNRLSIQLAGNVKIQDCVPSALSRSSNTLDINSWVRLDFRLRKHPRKEILINTSHSTACVCTNIEILLIRGKSHIKLSIIISFESQTITSYWFSMRVHNGKISQ